MASNHTTNYALPTWAAQDTILRDDFNDMTQKLDAALTRAETRVTLASYTTASAAAPLRIDVSGIDFTAYRCVRVCIDNLRAPSVGTVTLNGRTDEIYRPSQSLSAGPVGWFLTFGGNSTYGTSLELAFRGRGACLWAEASMCAYNSSQGFPDATIAHTAVLPDAISPHLLRSIELTPSAGSYAAGVKVTIYGEKL